MLMCIVSLITIDASCQKMQLIKLETFICDLFSAAHKVLGETRGRDDGPKCRWRLNILQYQYIFFLKPGMGMGRETSW